MCGGGGWGGVGGGGWGGGGGGGWGWGVGCIIDPLNLMPVAIIGVNLDYLIAIKNEKI